MRKQGRKTYQVEMFGLKRGNGGDWYGQTYCMPLWILYDGYPHLKLTVASINKVDVEAYFA